MFAVLAADGLAYLRHLDEETFGSREKAPLADWEQAVDMAHVRWAATTAVTTLDLLAGALGRLRCPPKAQGREYALEDFFDPAGQSLRPLLTPSGQAWIDRTWGDTGYQTVRRARNPFTHGRMKQVHYLSIGSIPKNHLHRTGFLVGPSGQEVRGRDLIETACRVVERRMGAFLAEVEAGTLP
jgi:hypothetical protein